MNDIPSAAKSGLLQRHLGLELIESLRSSRVVNIVGPRQVGKTTLVRDLFEGGAYLTLDDGDIHAAIERDPVGQLETLTRRAGAAPLIIDEAQRSKKLALAIKKIVDERRRMGQFILTGSSNIFTSLDVADSLAGRVSTLTMLPLSTAEVHGAGPALVLDWAARTNKRESPDLSLLPVPRRCKRETYIDLMIRGGYPEIRPLERRPRIGRLHAYIDTIVDRDVADILRVRKTDAMRRVIDQIAVRTSQELNVSELCNLVGLKRATADQYLDVLTRLTLIRRLGAWASGEGRREVRHPKMHVIDTGIVAALRNLSVESFDAVETPAALGGFMESFVYGEVLKSLPYQKERWRLYHWRRDRGREVDLIAEAGRRLVLIEVKASSMVGDDDFRHLRWFRNEGPGKTWETVGIVVHLGEHALTFGDGMFALPLSVFWSFDGPY